MPSLPVQKSASNPLQPRSLRLRLLLWYGTLLAVVLVFFGVLVWNLTIETLNQSVESSVQAEARVVGLDLSRKLSLSPPYWPSIPLSLQSVDAYRDPGIVVIVFDSQGAVRYSSNSNTARSQIESAMITSALAGQIASNTITVENGRARVLVKPIYAPTTGSSGTTNVAHKGPVIGALYVAKSLGEVDSTLLLLRTLLLFGGLVSMTGALIGGWAIAGRVLRPLSEMAKTARAIGTATAHGTRIGNLSQRVRRAGGGDEMEQVVDAFNEMLANLEKATQSQRRFVADASHELRAPLTTIQGNLAFLNRHMEELPPQERRTMLADAHSETLRLAELVEELLLLARADAGPDKLSAADQPEERNGAEAEPRQFLELDRIVLQLVRQFRGRLSVEDTGVRLEVGHIEPLHVQGTEENIRRVLLILLDNALKYTLTNGESDANRVSVSLERQGDEAVLRVHDTGIGIDAADLPHIFERFYRADRARSREGTGLGLAIAQTLIEQLHGRITVESTPGKGSTFNVWLPLA